MAWSPQNVFFRKKNRDPWHPSNLLSFGGLLVIRAACSRRAFLSTLAGLATGIPSARLSSAADLPRCQPAPRPGKPPKKLAVITTAYHYLSHAYHICSRFLNGYLRGGRMHYPDFGIAGMYVEQTKEGDLSRELARTHGFTLFPDIADALTLGNKYLAVDGVLLIAEHGDYPYNSKGQKLYPRSAFFLKIIEVFRRSGRVVPVFCDKHLSYDRNAARQMLDTAKQMGIPLFAGSSLPVTWRRPELELPLGVPIKEALVASRGELEIYGIHALEALQCMVERRTKGQQGVRAVTCLEGESVWKAGDTRLWSWELLDHALGRSPSRNVGDIRENCRLFVPPPGRPTFLRGPVAFLIEYRDGLRAAVFLLNGHHDDTTFAARLEGEQKPVSTLFYLPAPPGAGFLEALTVRMEEFLARGRPPYPVERTLLTGGMLDWVLESRIQAHHRLETPDLTIAYDPPADSGFMRGDYASPA
jgi:hypothetical protein